MCEEEKTKPEVCEKDKNKDGERGVGVETHMERCWEGKT